MKILLAEDEKELSRAVTAILEHSGYTVDAGYNGEEALELARNNAYDAMIFDIMMPTTTNAMITPAITLTPSRVVGNGFGALPVR